MSNPLSSGEEKVPVFKNWRGWYGLLLIVLILQLAFFVFLTWYF
jgi:hypothetical protein